MSRSRVRQRTGMCLECYKAAESVKWAAYRRAKPPKCLKCGETEPAKFALKSKSRCRACDNLRRSAGWAMRRAALDTYFGGLPMCDEAVGGCGMKDSHVVDGLCLLCVAEIHRGRLAVVVDETLLADGLSGPVLREVIHLLAVGNEVAAA